MVPILGFVRGDALGVVVLVQEQQTIAQLATVLVRAATPRVAPRPRARLFAGERELEPTLTVAAAGLTAMDRVDLVEEG